MLLERADFFRLRLADLTDLQLRIQQLGAQLVNLNLLVNMTPSLVGEVSIQIEVPPLQFLVGFVDFGQSLDQSFLIATFLPHLLNLFLEGLEVAVHAFLIGLVHLLLPVEGLLEKVFQHAKLLGLLRRLVQHQGSPCEDVSSAEAQTLREVITRVFSSD